MTRSLSPRRLLGISALGMVLAASIVLTLPTPPSLATVSISPSLGTLPAAAPDTLSDSARQQLLQDLSILAHDSMEGRRTGTPGVDRARRYLIEAFEARGIAPAAASYEHAFSVRTVAAGGDIEGVNLIARVQGSEFPDRHLVITAHYDHLGVVGGETFNGADDNASGTAALLAIAEHFVTSPPRHSILFAALDAEEMGLRGAREFLANPPVPLPSIALNVNLDMVSRSEAGELYAAGTYHYPFLAPFIAEIAEDAPITLLPGHDTPGLPPGDDWTLASDHGPFHEAGIPFLYFGVEDHPGYHAPSDTYDAITPDFFIGAVETILAFVRRVDAEGTALWEAAGR